MSDPEDPQLSTRLPGHPPPWAEMSAGLTGPRAWFRTARFGVFVHFGLYSLLGGTEDDYRRWDRNRYSRELMPKFAPAAFDADEWVRLVLSAGARYIVLTAKHGEGFCLWDTQTTEAKVTNTPFGRDIVGELADACHRHSLRLGVYLATDGMSADVERRYGRTEEGYCEYFGTQVRELVSGYGQVDVLWFDGSQTLLPPNRLAEIVRVARQLQPTLVVNDRGVHHNDTGDAHCGDFITPERFVPDRVAADHPFIEICDAMGVESWGYSRHQRFHSAAVLIRRLCLAASLGGNYLLNVEPRPDGRIRPECVERLEAIGRWLARRGEAVFEADECPAAVVQVREENLPPCGCCTARGDVLYAMLDSWPQSSEVRLPGVSGEVRRAALLPAGPELRPEQRDDGMAVTGFAAEGAANPVVKIEFRGGPHVSDGPQGAAGRVVTVRPDAPTFLKATDAALALSNDGISWNRVERYPNGNVSIGRWVRLSSGATWRLDAARAGRYRLFANLGTNADQAGAVLEFRVADSRLEFTTVENGWYGDYRCYRVGVLDIPAGRQELALTIKRMKFSSNVHGLILVAVERDGGAARRQRRP